MFWSFPLDYELHESKDYFLFPLFIPFLFSTPISHFIPSASTVLGTQQVHYKCFLSEREMNE